jgi:3-oxoacyl-[acyl-carrier-protein] synthase II
MNQMNSLKRRVVVTGLGAVTPLGIGVERSWHNLCNGKPGICEITRFDTTGFGAKIAAEVKDFNAEDFIDKKLARRMDRYIHFALASAQMAVEDAKLKISDNSKERVGVSVGTTAGGMETWERNQRLLLQGARQEISPFFIPAYMTSMAAAQIAMRFGAKGPNFAPTTACAASTHALGDALRLIQRGDVEIMIAGGSEAGIVPLTISGLDAMKVLSSRNDAPQKASRPFDRDRDGFVTGEGAGIVILEELDFALERGADIYAELVGYGANCDAYHITSPSPDGEGAVRCMRLALADADITPDEVDYINAHGTSTVLNDRLETMAIKAVFGEHAKKLAISSNKSMIGHLWGGSGAVEAIFTVLTIKEGIIPPTINYETPDPECDLDYVPNRARKAKVRMAISNSFGFGGTNGGLVFKEFDGG